MPFTLSHVAAVLPLRGDRIRRVVDFPALVVGAMAPDTSYLVGLFGFYREAHDLRGMLLYAWPTATVLAWLYHRFLRRSWSTLLPWLDEGRPAPTAPVLLVSALAGVVTHVGWDAFTHADGAFVALFPPLARLLPILGLDVPVYEILQYGSSLVGLAAVLVAIGRACRRRNVPLVTSTRTLARLVAAFVVLWGLFLVLPLVPTPSSFVPVWIVDGIFRALLAAGVVFVAFGAWSSFARR